MLPTNVPDFVDMETGKYPPLGLLYVAGSILAAGRHTVEILDCHVQNLDYEKIEREIAQRRADLFGIQATSFTLIDVANIAAICKRTHPDVPVAIGGPHTFLFPEETINLPVVDFVFIGEGEQNIVPFLDCFEKGTDLSTVPGLVYRKDGEIVRTPLPPLIADLDTLPIPPRHLLPYKNYYSLLAQHTPITTMMSSRGCPYRCLFCDRPHLGKKWRARSPQNIVNEIKECTRMGIREIFFYDDTFNIDKNRIIALCDLIVDEKIDVTWDVRARVDVMTPEVIRKMARAGCRRIHYGVEAGTDEIVKVLRKDIDLDKAKEVFHATQRAGITALGYFMIGNPTETREHIMRTIDFALNLDADYVHFSITTPFPGTDLYRLALEQGVIDHDCWREFAANPQKDFVPPFWEENLTRDELIELLMLAYKKFYFRWKHILRQVVKVRTPGEFLRKAHAGFNVLFKA